VFLTPSLTWYPSTARGRSGGLCESLPRGREPWSQRTSYARSRQRLTLCSFAAGRATNPTPASRAGGRTPA
jgi:hypothetical protein